MTFAEINRTIREKQSIEMSVMTLNEKNKYIKKGAKQIQARIEEIKKQKMVNLPQENTL